MDNLKLLLLLIVSSASIYAQQLDDKYLESLPEDIKKDLMNKTAQGEAESQNNFRPSIYSSKLEQAEELIELKTRLEKDLLELEKRLKSDEQLSINNDLELFGSDFFDTFQTTFMPINEPNLDDSYILDTGDVLNIQLVGQEDYIEKFVIGRDGAINIPDIGTIVMAGLSLDNASQLIKSKIQTAFIGTEAYINLDQLRDVSILVSGNAKNPGIYTLSGSSNVLHALSVAGGINQYGSYREINLIRDKKIVETLDVYDLLINGNFNLKNRLKTGDIIFVEPRKTVVTIDGAIKRPAKYELNDSEYLYSVINYANGIKHTADFENIYLERILDGKLKSLPIVNVTQFKSIQPQDGDLIYVREFSYRTAKITGAVYKPGTYVMAAGETISDLVNKAGGYTDNAYPFGAVYEKEAAKDINKKAQDLLYSEFLDNIIALSQINVGQDFDLMPIVNLIEEIKNTKPSGRVVVDLIAEEYQASQNVSEGDMLIIPEKTNSVFVYGEVSSEGAVAFEANKEVDYYVEKSGGYKNYADNLSIYILHPNGETERYSRKRNLFASQPNSSIEIYPGSIIFVPRKLDNSVSRRLATQAYVSILGNLGVALASLSAIDNN